MPPPSRRLPRCPRRTNDRLLRELIGGRSDRPCLHAASRQECAQNWDQTSRFVERKEALEMRVYVEEQLSGGDFHRTRTVNHAGYVVEHGRSPHYRIVPFDGGDADLSPRRLDDADCPVESSNLIGGARLRLTHCGRSVQVGKLEDKRTAVGEGSQTVNIGGTFVVAPEPGQPDPGRVA